MSTSILRVGDASVNLESPGCYRVMWDDGSFSEAYPFATAALLDLLVGKARRMYPLHLQDSPFLREMYDQPGRYTGD